MGLDNPLHIAFLLVLLLLVFGARRLPEMGRSLGSGLRGFRDALSGQGTQQSVATDAVQPAAVAAELPPRPSAASEADGERSLV
jgi:sec-independent protein translocase protein TatA